MLINNYCGKKIIFQLLFSFWNYLPMLEQKQVEMEIYVTLVFHIFIEKMGDYPLFLQFCANKSGVMMSGEL